jgi:PA14 domain/Carbohydrate binding module (family 6)/Secretion system C-terminal sorting domain
MKKINSQKKTKAISLAISLLIGFSFTVRAEVPAFDSDKPVVTVTDNYVQTYIAGTDVNTLLPHWWVNDYANAANFSSGYLQFVWSTTRILASTTVYTAPYSLETDIEYGSASNRGGVVIRLDNALYADAGIQDPAQGDPGFNRHGIAFYPTTDGANIIVQFTGALNGNSTPVTRILIPKPSGIGSLMNRGTMKIEDFGTSIYVYYNGSRFVRINLGGLTGGKYTSGTVYDADMVSKGTFTSMQVPETGGRVAIAQRDAALRLYSSTIKTLALQTGPLVTFDSDKPDTTYNAFYSQAFNSIEGWDNTKFYNQWTTFAPNTFSASDITSGYLKFQWDPKRVMCSNLKYTQPYILETDIDYSTGSNRGGVVIRGRLIESLQEPDRDPGFNRQGIAFYPSSNGDAMTVQFSGTDMGELNGTSITRILVPKPVGVTSLLNRGVLRIEDFGATVYVYYNGAPYIRIDLSNKTERLYSSGTVYDSGMKVMGTFTDMVVDITGKVAIAQRDATLRLYSAKINSNVYTPIVLPIDTTTFASAYRDLYSDTWVATDALGRKMPTYDEVGPVKADKKRVVSIFYVTWHTEDKNSTSRSPFTADVTKILKTNPAARLDGTNALWKDEWYHWGEPEMGYFLNQDEYVIRKDMAMFAAAGVDLLVLDVTNAVKYWDEWEVLFYTMHKMRAEGNKVPKFCFWAFNGPVITVVQELYEKYYKNPKYQDLWFYWEGKPLMLYNGTPATDASGSDVKSPNLHYEAAAVTDVNNPHYGDPYYTQQYYTDYTQEVKDFFTKRNFWWGYYEWAGKRFVGTEDNWSFGYDLGDARVAGMNPDDLVSTHNGRKEQAAVTPAQHPSSMIGKSWRRNTGEPKLNDYDMPVSAYVPWLGKTVSNPEDYGIYFQDRWDEAIKTDPDFLYINDWNEWSTVKFNTATSFMGRNNNFFFLDQYNAEFNRCVQPMKDGYADNYYMQMTQNIRKYKGVSSAPVQQSFNGIGIDGVFADWTSIVNEYRDAKGDTFHRNHDGYGGLYYLNKTGRNDIITSKVTYDQNNISFYVKTVEALSPSTDPNWMLLFIDADRNKSTGWEGYDYVVNLGVKTATETTLKKWDGMTWSSEVIVPYKLVGNEMELSLPRTAVLMDKSIPEFYFKWSDNAQQLNNINCFFTDGDAAPDRRFNYNFSSSKIQTVPRTEFKMLKIPGSVELEDFDNGGVGVAYADATYDNEGGAYRPNESVDIETKAGGGYSISSIITGEWLEYTVNVTAIGKFTASINYAASGVGNEVLIYMDDNDKSGIIAFPSTGSLNTWSTVDVELSLIHGKHTLKFFVKNSNGNFKLDNILFTEKQVVYPGNGTGLNKSLWTATAGGRTWFVDSICSQIVPVIDEVWVDVSPGCNIAKDYWNARWQGQIKSLYTELYTFYLTVNDMGRVWINNQLTVDAWNSTSSGKTIIGTIALTAGEKVPIKVDFAEKTGLANAKLEWSSASTPREVVPQYQLFPDALTDALIDLKVARFNVSPNPATDMITINTDQNNVESIEIRDLTGRNVYSNKESFSGSKSVSLSLAKGIYVIKLTGNVSFSACKLIIK